MEFFKFLAEYFQNSALVHPPTPIPSLICVRQRSFLKSVTSPSACTSRVKLAGVVDIPHVVESW